MTPERAKELEAVMDGIIEREIARMVRDTSGPIADGKLLHDLAEISACISTAYKLLSGEAFKGILREVKS